VRKLPISPVCRVPETAVAQVACEAVDASEAPTTGGPGRGSREREGAGTRPSWSVPLSWIIESSGRGRPTGAGRPTEMRNAGAAAARELP